METTSEQSLLKAARAGDRDALEELIARHQHRLFRFSMKLCHHPEDAEDVLQDTLLTMARSIRDFQGRSSLSTWLYTVARSFCIKKRRKSKFAPREVKSLERDVAPEALADPARTPDEAVAGKQVEVALEVAIRRLEPDHREVLLLRDVEGLTAKEVAEVLDLSVAAVKSRLHRARLKVREHIAPLLAVGEPAAAPTATGCSDVLNTFSKYLEDEISAEICVTMERHVAECARCRGACDTLKRTLALCKNVPSPRVPESLQRSVRAAVREFLASARG